ncbi:MAG: TauD/TfdA family dioxygenase [Pseudomonadales bacterium]
MNSVLRLDQHDKTLAQLTSSGWVLLREECSTRPQFDELLGKFLSKVTFDPARSAASNKTQMVDSGSDPIGLHIENGNTPLPPDIIAFHCVSAAKRGSQTTVCDGQQLWSQLPVRLRTLFANPITVRRTLDCAIWKRYVATALGRVDHELITAQDLHHFLKQVPGQTGVLRKDGSLDYILTINAVRTDNMLGVKAFANALMGPSFNYEKPTYCASDGTLIEPQLIDEISQLAQALVHDISWANGDVLLIDNKRVMHGRRAIIGPSEERVINIGMGTRL